MLHDLLGLCGLPQMSTNCFAGRGNVLKLRAQITSFRFAQLSRIRTIAIGIDCAQRRAAASGTTAMPTSAATIWQIASKSRNRARKRKAHAELGGMFGDVQVERGRVGQPDEVVAGGLLEIDLAPAGEGRCAAPIPAPGGPR